MKLKVLELKDEVDLNGDIMPPNAQIKFDKRIMLTRNFSSDLKDIVGEADLVREDNSFYISNINLMNKSFKAVFELTYPAIGGHIRKRDGINVTDFMIDMVSFGIGKNVDIAIKSVGEQLKEQNERTKKA